MPEATHYIANYLSSKTGLPNPLYMAPVMIVSTGGSEVGAVRVSPTESYTKLAERAVRNLGIEYTAADVAEYIGDFIDVEWEELRELHKGV